MVPGVRSADWDSNLPCVHLGRGTAKQRGIVRARRSAAGWCWSTPILTARRSASRWTRRCWLVTGTTGGGDIPEDADISGWSVQTTEVSEVTVEPGQAVILLNASAPSAAAPVDDTSYADPGSTRRERTDSHSPQRTDLSDLAGNGRRLKLTTFTGAAAHSTAGACQQLTAIAQSSAGIGHLLDGTRPRGRAAV